MKLDPAVGLIMVLFATMVGATSLSAFWGYALGRQALSGITQPDIRRTSADEEPERASNPSQNQTVLKSEDEILANVIARMNGTLVNNSITDTQSTSAVANRPETEEPIIQTVADESSLDNDSDVSLVTYQQSLPISAENNQVVLTINSIQRQFNNVQVSLSLQNTGDRSVEFLYSLMDVLDDQDQPLSVSTDGLPQEIPPTGEIFQGSVTIPTVLVGSSDTLSFQLMDYPEQQVNLQINDIPIAQ